MSIEEAPSASGSIDVAAACSLPPREMTIWSSSVLSLLLTPVLVLVAPVVLEEWAMSTTVCVA